MGCENEQRGCPQPALTPHSLTKYSLPTRASMRLSIFYLCLLCFCNTPVFADSMVYRTHALALYGDPQYPPKRHIFRFGAMNQGHVVPLGPFFSGQFLVHMLHHVVIFGVDQ